MDQAFRNHRYFLALIPPEPLFSQIQDFKTECAEQFSTRAALRSPPHITLHMPFLWPVKSEKRLLHSLARLAASMVPCPVILKGFGCFSPRVIFVHVEPCIALQEMQKTVQVHFRQQLQIFNATYNDTQFHPHITIAFRDLKKSQFHKAWEAFEARPFGGQFEAQSFALLKHTGKIWEIDKEFELAGASRPIKE